MRRRPLHPALERRGLSLVIVMAVLATAAVLAVALLQAQSSALRALENGVSGDRARQAAEAGLAAALDRLRDPNWTGVTEELTAEVGRDEGGFWSYQATYHRPAAPSNTSVPPSPLDEANAAASALRVLVRSVGSWQRDVSTRRVQRVAEAVVELTPRLPGHSDLGLANRPSRPGDVAAADDLADDVVGFDQSRRYSVFATNDPESLVVGPQARILGGVWLDRQFSILSDLACNATERDALLAGIATDAGLVDPSGAPAAPSPYPLAGALQLHTTPAGTTPTDLTRLMASWSTTTTLLDSPAFDPTRFITYRLYAGGHEHAAVEVGPILQGDAQQNVSLGPTAANPLGIFFCNGSLSVRGDVEIRGTLVASSGVTFEGRDNSIVPFDWRDGEGGTPVVDRSLWPVLPALVAGGAVTVLPTAQVFVEGAVLAGSDVIVNTPDFAQESALLSELLSYSGTATAKPLGGGLSEVRLGDLSLLSTLDVSAKHEVLLNAPSGRWHPVVAVLDVLAGKVLVRGTAEFSSPVGCRIRLRRVGHADFAGPMSARRVRFETPPAWSNLSSSEWNAKYGAWQSKRNGILGILLARPDLTFSKSLEEDGLSFEPTARVSRPQNVNYACEPPLFRPDPSARSAGGGYRWKILSWRGATL